MLQTWPLYNEGFCDKESESHMQIVMETVKAIRQIRSEMNVPPGKTAEVTLLASGETVARVLKQNVPYISDLAFAKPRIFTELDTRPESAAHAVTGDVEVFVSLKGLIDLEKEFLRLKKQLAGIEKELETVGRKMNNPGFLKKAPRDVVEKEKSKQDELSIKSDALSKRLMTLSAFLK